MTTTNPPVPVFIGFRRKERRPRPAGWCDVPAARQVVEIWSVSNCVVGGPELCYDGPLGGETWSKEESIGAWLFTDPAKRAELRSVGVHLAPDDHFHVCAYRAYRWKFEGDAPPVLLEPSQLFAADYPLPLPEPDWAAFERLGYDVVQFEPARLLDLEGEPQDQHGVTNGSYGCSPLSCNGMASEHPVNRYCLFDDLEAAYQAGLAFGREQPEPAPYVVVEVLRRRE